MLALTLSGCSDRVSEELRPYIDSFYQDAERLGLHPESWTGSAEFTDKIEGIGIDEGPDGTGPLGVCKRVPLTRKRIEIRRDGWDKLGPYGRKWVMYHELGPCVLDREHIEGYAQVFSSREFVWADYPVELAVPNSIMLPKAFSNEAIAERMWPALVEELMLGRSLHETSLVLGDGEREVLYSRWKELLDPVIDRFVAEAKLFDVELERPIFHFRQQLPDAEFARSLDVQHVASELTFWTQMSVGVVLSPDSQMDLSAAVVELVVYGILAEILVKKPDYRYGVEVHEGRTYPQTLRKYWLAVGNPDFETYYTTNRASFVRELFTGTFAP